MRYFLLIPMLIIAACATMPQPVPADYAAADGTCNDWCQAQYIRALDRWEIQTAQKERDAEDFATLAIAAIRASFPKVAELEPDKRALAEGLCTIAIRRLDSLPEASQQWCADLFAPAPEDPLPPEKPAEIKA